MIRRQLRIYVSLLAVFLLCGLIAQATAGDNHKLLPTKANNRTTGKASSQFSVSGPLTGDLSGYVTVGGKKVFITRTTAVRRIGGGKIEPGASVANAYVYVTGTVRRGIPTASLVLVGSSSGLGEQSLARLNKNDKYGIPSDSNPDVGELKENTPE
jgi:hypothetical protein